MVAAIAAVAANTTLSMLNSLVGEFVLCEISSRRDVVRFARSFCPKFHFPEWSSICYTTFEQLVLNVIVPWLARTFRLVDCSQALI